MFVAQFDRGSFLQGCIRRDTFSAEQRANLKAFVRGITSMAKPDQPEETDKIAEIFCTEFGVEVANCDAFGSFLSFVGGVNDDWKELGDCAIYLM